MEYSALVKKNCFEIISFEIMCFHPPLRLTVFCVLLSVSLKYMSDNEAWSQSCRCVHFSSLEKSREKGEREKKSEERKQKKKYS